MRKERKQTDRFRIKRKEREGHGRTRKEKRKEKAYQDYVKTKTPVHNVYLNMAKHL
mgnify:CR=1 FL=1